MKFRELKRTELSHVTTAIDQAAWGVAQQIIDDVRQRGKAALHDYGVQFDSLPENGQLIHSPQELESALGRIADSTRDTLKRTAERIRKFAQAQRDSLQDIALDVPGGVAGSRWISLQSAGCYAPGGRYPLPSSVLMTAVTARVAGVRDVWVASPNPDDVTLAAASLAGADGVLAVGGAQAIAALAIGLSSELPSCDVIVGPGNKYVTAAKAIVSRQTRIDMLAGPSELVVVAGKDANARWVAADLLAQAEHDPDARPVLITNSQDLLDAVQLELEKQLSQLPTQDVASQALASGGYCLVPSLRDAIECCQEISPEHLSLQGREFESEADAFKFGAALFVGPNTAEVLGDYGAGPNHVLPTGGSARRESGLSVMNFMRIQTILEVKDLGAAGELLQDAASMANLEGLSAHARSSEWRRQAILEA